MSPAAFGKERNAPDWHAWQLVKEPQTLQFSPVRLRFLRLRGAVLPKCKHMHSRGFAQVQAHAQSAEEHQLFIWLGNNGTMLNFVPASRAIHR